MPDDAELLHRYAEQGSEEAFRELVRRHLDLVYTAALRRMDGDAQGAEDVTQIVFTELARRARGLSKPAALAGWLYTATRNAALKFAISERRRRVRETAAQEGAEGTGLGSSPVHLAVDWERVRPVLDEAMDRLGGSDRDAILLRFFEGRSFREVSDVLKVSEDSARMRVSRALEKLRDRLVRNGVTSTVAALGVLLAENGSREAPSGLAGTTAGAALSGAGSGTLPVLISALTVGKLGGVALLVAAILSLGGLAYRLGAGGIDEVGAADAAAARRALAGSGGAARSDGATEVAARLSLADILAEPDQIKAYGLFARHLAVLPAEEFPKEVGTIVGIQKIEQYDMFFSLFLTRWGQVDPLAALAAADAVKITPRGHIQTTEYLRMLVLRGWAATDPAPAAEWVIDQAGGPGFAEKMAVWPADEARKEARLLNGRFSNILGSMREIQDYRAAAALVSNYAWAIRDAGRLSGNYAGPYREFTEEVRERSARNAVAAEAGGLVEAWARVDPKAAAVWLDRDFPKEADKTLAVVGYVRGVAAEDPGIAIRMVESFTDPATRSSAATALVTALAARGDDRRALSWLAGQAAENGDGVLDAAIEAFFATSEAVVAPEAPQAESARRLLAQIQKPELRVATARTYARTFVGTAPGEAIQVMSQFLPQSELWAELSNGSERWWSMTSIPFVVMRWSREDLGAAVSFIETMPSLTPEQRATLLAAAREQRGPK